eukprot:6468377-Amphidinium_carterae.4
MHETELSGCTALPKCKLGAASTHTGYTPTNCGTSANPVTIDTCGAESRVQSSEARAGVDVVNGTWLKWLPTSHLPPLALSVVIDHVMSAFVFAHDCFHRCILALCSARNDSFKLACVGQTLAKRWGQGQDRCAMWSVPGCRRVVRACNIVAACIFDLLQHVDATCPRCHLRLRLGADNIRRAAIYSPSVKRTCKGSQVVVRLSTLGGRAQLRWIHAPTMTPTSASLVVARFRSAQCLHRPGTLSVAATRAFPSVRSIAVTMQVPSLEEVWCAGTNDSLVLEPLESLPIGQRLAKLVPSTLRSGGNLWESQCGVSCAADYTGIQLLQDLALSPPIANTTQHGPSHHVLLMNLILCLHGCTF